MNDGKMPEKLKVGDYIVRPSPWVRGEAWVHSNRLRGWLSRLFKSIKPNKHLPYPFSMQVVKVKNEFVQCAPAEFYQKAQSYSRIKTWKTELRDEFPAFAVLRYLHNNSCNLKTLWLDYLDHINCWRETIAAPSAEDDRSAGVIAANAESIVLAREIIAQLTTEERTLIKRLVLDGDSGAAMCSEYGYSEEGLRRRIRHALLRARAIADGVEIKERKEYKGRRLIRETRVVR
jgi:hypothetical protein